MTLNNKKLSTFLWNEKDPEGYDDITLGANGVVFDEEDGVIEWDLSDEDMKRLRDRLNEAFENNESLTFRMS